ncbi:MAG: FMN-binding protein [Deltaproteobacteria bacterium]|nr:FMN-binding protein [Deltaproteobacteria bacterium]
MTAGLGDAGPREARLVYYLLFLATGLLSGAAFRAAGALGERATAGAGELGSLLESADHWGAAAGALVAGALMVPALGVAASCGVVAALLAAAALLALLGERVPLALVQRLLRAVHLLGAPAADPAARHRALSFPWTGLSYLLVGVTAAAVLLGVQARAAARRPEAPIDREQLQAAVPAERFEELLSPFHHYRAYRTQEGEERFFNVTLSSLAVAGDVVGYAGPLDLLVSVDEGGTIRRVALLGSQETPAYVAGLPDWLRRFEGQSVQRAFAPAAQARGPEQAVDVLTGASVSSRAAIETVNRAAGAAAEKVLGLPVERASRAASGPPWQPEEIYLALALLLCVPVFLRAPAWLRLVFLAANLVLAGLCFNVQLSLTHLLGMIDAGLPSPSSRAPFLLIAGAGALDVAFGPIYCSVLCPFGAAQELVFVAWHPTGLRRGFDWPRAAAVLGALGLAGLLVDRASPLFFPQVASRPLRDVLLGAVLLGALWALRRAAAAAGGPVSPGVHARARYLKYLLLAAALAIYALGGAGWVGALDPLAVAFSGAWGAWTFVLLAALVLLCLGYFRFWCRFFCPAGAALSLLGKIGLLRALARPKAYGCCDLGVRSAHDIDCLQCNRCLTGAVTASSRCLAAPTRGGATGPEEEDDPGAQG